MWIGSYDRRHTCPECRAHVSASASKSRLFVADKERQSPPRTDKRMPRFHGG
jgi:hypothetical protein